MKKSLVLLAVVLLVVSLSGCTKKEDAGFAIDAGKLKTKVFDWKIYTNPAYRYELRFPTDWSVYDSGEDGKQAAFYPTAHGEELKSKNETYFGAMVILAKSNWKEEYTLEDYYRQQTENLFLGNYEQEKVTIGGVDGVWFKNVRNRNIEKPDLLVDVIALDLQDRILEIEVQEKEYWEDIKTILNSMTFYPNAAPAGME